MREYDIQDHKQPPKLQPLDLAKFGLIADGAACDIDDPDCEPDGVSGWGTPSAASYVADGGTEGEHPAEATPRPTESGPLEGGEH